MRLSTLLTLTLALALPVVMRADVPKEASKAETVISRGLKADLDAYRKPEQPTVFVFMKANSTLERTFLSEVRRDAGEKVGFGVIELKTGTEPIAGQYAVTETPTALIYDRRGRLVARSADPNAIRDAIKKATGVMRIDWAEEDD